jgi:hypothetical protein
MTTVVILQPGYLPWLGFFDQLRRADVFVYYDDVQYDKHGWRNRNRIKTQAGPLWLSVPVRHGGLGFPRMIDLEIDARTPWARKHLASIQQAYARAPYASRYLPDLADVMHQKWHHLVELNIALAGLMAAWFGLTRRIERSSALRIPGEKTQRIVDICRHFGATKYVSGDAAQDYLDVPLLETSGIAVEWQRYRHPVYPQLHGEFVPYMSALDLLLNCGDEARCVLEMGTRP